MKKLATALLLIIFLSTAQAQQNAIDSLKKLITYTKADTSRVLLMNKLSLLYVYSKPYSALLLAQQGLQISESAQFLKGEGYCLADEGLIFSVIGNYPKALSSLFKALKIGENINDHFIVEKCLHDIAIIYSNEGDYRQCVNYIGRAKKVANANHDVRALGIILLDLGDSYEKLNLLDSSLIYTRQAYLPFVKLKDTDLMGALFNNLGNIYAKMHHPDTALKYYRRSMVFEKQQGDDDALCETTLGLAQIFTFLNVPDSGLYYARQSVAAGRHGGFTIRILAASQFLTAYYKKLHQPDSAFHYQEVSIAAKDSLFSQEKIKEVQNIGFLDRQQRQDIEMQQAAYQGRIRYYVLVIVIASLLVIAFILWRSNHKNEKARRLQQAQKEKIQITLGELKTTQNQLVQSAKMASLGELTAGIAHEIQNPLNFVNNFSEVSIELMDELMEELNNDNTNEAKALTADITENLTKINHHGKRADFIVKGMLEHSRNSTGERQLSNINTLTEEFLKLSYHGLRVKNNDFNVELITHFDQDLPEMNVLQQDIGRVLINLFSNAFYAVNKKAQTAGKDYKPQVIVSTFAPPSGGWGINVKDNGDGIPGTIKEKIMQPFFTTKPTGEGTGLGLSLSYDVIVKGHGGSITSNSVAGEGAEFIVLLPPI